MMKALRNTILVSLAAFLFSSCSKTFNCTCYLYNKQAAIENGSQVIVIESKALNAKKRAERSCEQHEVDLTSDAQSASCNLQ